MICNDKVLKFLNHAIFISIYSYMIYMYIFITYSLESEEFVDEHFPEMKEESAESSIAPSSTNDKL